MACVQAPWRVALSSELQTCLLSPTNLSRGGVPSLSADENTPGDLSLASPTAELVQCLERRTMIIRNGIIKQEILAGAFLDSLHHLLPLPLVVPKLHPAAEGFWCPEGVSGGRDPMTPPRSVIFHGVNSLSGETFIAHKVNHFKADSHTAFPTPTTLCNHPHLSSSSP